MKAEEGVLDVGSAIVIALHAWSTSNCRQIRMHGNKLMSYVTTCMVILMLTCFL